MFKFLEWWFGDDFLKGNTFIDFIKDGIKIGLFMFSPFIPLACALVIDLLIKLLIGG